MTKAFAIAMICCICVLAALMAAGCTGTTSPSSIPSTTVPQETAVLVATPAASLPSTSVAVATEAATPVSTTATVTTVFVNSTSNGGIITIPANERVLVRLNENPTTGYVWNATASKGLTIVSDTYTAPNTALVGAGGYHEWILSPTTVDTYTFKAVYLRPWEGADPTDTTFGIVIQVVPA